MKTPMPMRAFLLALLLASPAFADDALTFHVTTGGDDLRGGNDNVHLRAYDNDGRLVGSVDNANGLQRLADHSSRTMNLRLQPGVRWQDIGAVELVTTLGGGVGGDNWNLEQLRVTSASDHRRVLFEATGRPLFRFTGEARTKRFPVLVHQCSADAECDNGVGADGAERCLPTPRRIDGQRPRLCQAGQPLGCPSGQVPSADGRRCETAPMRPVDADGDGVASAATGGADCDDSDRNRYPGNIEICDADGFDEDCDLQTGGARDADGDGFNDSACFNWGPQPGR
ncbi:MAG: putative metal-binding motif-containing protein [Rhizobium sp.]|nr:putative metal-binding motif-containing protein [Rhizobium sp.]